jgi:hypothetical protein
MLLKAAGVWVVGLLTLVPYSGYYLLFEAPREQYAPLITLVLFWVFGYWGVVGPLLMALKIRSVFRTLETARSRDDLIEALKSPDAKDVAIDFISRENGVPRFLARRIYELLIPRLAERAQAQGVEN